MFKPETNFAIDKNKAQIIKHYQRISDREAYVTAEMVRNALLERLCRRKEKQVLLVSMNNRMPYECQSELFMFSHNNTYADIKHLKNESRTYFFDSVAERKRR